MTLLLHCGAEEVDYDALRSLERPTTTPARLSTLYRMVRAPHRSLLTSTDSQDPADARCWR